MPRGRRGLLQRAERLARQAADLEEEAKRTEAKAFYLIREADQLEGERVGGASCVVLCRGAAHSSAHMPSPRGTGGPMRLLQEHLKLLTLFSEVLACSAEQQQAGEGAGPGAGGAAGGHLRCLSACV